MGFLELLGGLDTGLTLYERYQQRRTEAGFQALKRALVQVLLLRSMPASRVEDPNDPAMLLLRKRSPWRDRLDEAVDYETFLQLFREMGIIGERGLTPDQDEVVQALVTLTEEQLDRGTRYNAAQLRGLQDTLNLLVFPAADAARRQHEFPVLNHGETPYGEESVVLGQVGVPLVTPWTAALEEIFLPGAADHEDRFQGWQQGTDPALTPLERAVRHAVAEEWDEAMELLRSLDTSAWFPERKVARLRLMGTLERGRGHSGRAERFYQQARDLISHLHQPYQAWLERRLLLDLNSLRSEEDDLSDVLDRHATMLGVPAWFSIPVVDALAGDIAGELALEALEERYKSPLSSRTSNRLYSAWVSYLKALHFAYAAGDAHAARGLHTLWGRLLLTLPEVPLVEALEALWTARDSDTVVRVLRERLTEAASALDWPARLLVRPTRPEGTDAEQWHLLVLRATSILAPLLPDDTVDRLRAELVAGLTRFHPLLKAGIPTPTASVPFVQGHSYSSTYAVEALRALCAQRPLSAAEVSTLVTSLEGVPFSPFSAWLVLAEHQWQAENRAAALHAAPFLEHMDGTWYREQSLRLLRDLALTYTDAGLGERFMHALSVASPESLGSWERWWLLLGEVLPAAEATVHAGAAEFITAAVRDLAHVERTSTILGRSHAVIFLPPLVALEPPVLPLEELTALTRDVLDAATLPGQDRGYGRDALRSLRLAWPLLPPAVQADLAARLDAPPPTPALALPSQQGGRNLDHPSSALPLEQLLLRVTAGLPLREADRHTLIHVLLSGQAAEVETALSAAQVLLIMGRLDSGDLFTAIFGATRAPFKPAGHALYLLTRFPPADDGHQAMVAEAARLALSTHPLSLDAASGTLQGLAHLPATHPLRLILTPDIETLRAHPHRHVRRQVADLLNGGGAVVQGPDHGSPG